MHLSSYSSGAAAASIRRRLLLIPRSHPDQRYLTERNTDKDTFFSSPYSRKLKENHTKHGGEAAQKAAASMRLKEKVAVVKTLQPPLLTRAN